MERFLYSQIERSKDRYQRDKYFDILERWIGLKDGFRDGFLNIANIKFPILRYNLGSSFAVLAATYNLYSIRNLILRYTIALFKTKN